MEKKILRGPMGPQSSSGVKTPEEMVAGVWYPRNQCGSESDLVAFAQAQDLNLELYGPDYTGWGLAWYRHNGDTWSFIGGDGLSTPDEEYVRLVKND